MIAEMATTLMTPLIQSGISSGTERYHKKTCAPTRFAMPTATIGVHRREVATETAARVAGPAADAEDAARRPVTTPTNSGFFRRRWPRSRVTRPSDASTHISPLRVSQRPPSPQVAAATAETGRGTTLGRHARRERE